MTRLGLVRSGGVAGLRREVTLDTLTHPDGPWFEAELSRLDPTETVGSEVPAPEPDHVQYDLTVETESSSHRFRFGDEVPSSLSPLVRRLLDITAS